MRLEENFITYKSLSSAILQYSGVASVEVRIDDEEDVPYVYMEDPSAPEITFVRAPCPSKEVLYVRCSDLGTNPLLTYIISFYLLHKRFGTIMHAVLHFF